jgi:hypothetical protein
MATILEQNYWSVAKRISDILERDIDKKNTVIHCDGKPSVQKSAERARRNGRLESDLQKLTSRVNSLSRKVPSSIYGKCKNLYRIPPEALDNILQELYNMQWNVCRCPFQSDTHIADLCRKSSNKDIVIITKDSDLIVYEDVNSITIPVGRAHELTTFEKVNVMESMKLPSPRHLLLAGIVSTNDYSKGVPWYGLTRNTEIVRDIKLDYEPGSCDLVRVGAIQDALETYLANIKRPHSKVLEGYDNAISAFVQCKEVWSDSAVSSASTHDQICGLLRKLELMKIARKASPSCPAPPKQPSSVLQLISQPKQQRREKQRNSIWESSRYGIIIALPVRLLLFSYS